jgi:hypothetical protein
MCDGEQYARSAVRYRLRDAVDDANDRRFVRIASERANESSEVP